MPFKDIILVLCRPFCSVDQNNLCNFGRRFTHDRQTIAGRTHDRRIPITVAHIEGPRPVNVFLYTPLQLLSRLWPSQLLNHNEAVIELQIGPSSINKQE